MPPKKSVDKLREKLVEVEQWATGMLDVLRLRDGDCFKAKLRQLGCDEEKRIYKFLVYHRKRLKGSAALAAQLAKLDCSVMAPGDTGLHAVVPSAASGSSNARCSTDAGLSAQEEGRRRSPRSNLIYYIYPYKKRENRFLEELAEVEQWARANINVLRAREGDGFRSKLRQLNGSEEKRIYFLLTKHKERIEASAALAAQLANLDSIVMAPGEASLTATLPLTASGSRKARCSTDAGLNAQEEGKKRSKTEARGQIGSAGRSDTCGSAGASKSESAMSRDSMVEASVTLASRQFDSAKKMLLQVRRSHFNAIQSERKLWEGRPLVERRKDGSFAPWKFLHLATEGRVVKFQSGSRPNLVMRVAEVRYFVRNKCSSITPEQAMVMELGSELLPDAADAGARVQVYRDIYGVDRCSRGFVAMRLQWADGMKLADKPGDAERS